MRVSIGPRLGRRPSRPNWYILWPDGRGRLCRTSTGTEDRGQAELELAAFIGLRARPEDPAVGGLIEQYLLEHPTRSSERHRYAADRLQTHFLAMPASALTREAVREYLAARQAEGAAETTVGRELVVLRAALGHAVKERRLTTVPHIDIPRPRPARDRWLTRAEARRLLTACRLPHLRLFVELALNTGARRGALLGLTWDRVDLRRRRIDLNPAGAEQTGKRRPVVPVNDRLFRALKSARRCAQGPFVLSYRGQALKGLRRAFRRACERAGLVDVTPHTLRHTAGSWMAQAGVPLFDIGAMLGPSAMPTTTPTIWHTRRRRSRARIGRGIPRTNGERAGVAG